MRSFILVTAFAFIGTSGVALAAPQTSHPGISKADSAIVQVKAKKKQSTKENKGKGMKGMDHSKMKM